MLDKNLISWPNLVSNGCKLAHDCQAALVPTIVQSSVVLYYGRQGIFSLELRKWTFLRPFYCLSLTAVFFRQMPSFLLMNESLPQNGKGIASSSTPQGPQQTIRAPSQSCGKCSFSPCRGHSLSTPTFVCAAKDTACQNKGDRYVDEKQRFATCVFFLGLMNLVVFKLWASGQVTRCRALPKV